LTLAAAAVLQATLIATQAVNPTVRRRVNPGMWGVHHEGVVMASPQAGDSLSIGGCGRDDDPAASVSECADGGAGPDQWSARNDYDRFRMADRADLDFTYSQIDRIFRLSLGELADFSGAKYDGDFSLSLEEAQRRKHEYVAEQIGIGPGRRVLDLGCGWGPLLNFIRDRGGTGVGVTLSSAQVAACRRHGLDVHLYDVRQVTRDSFGSFDAVACVGGFEHFCSPDEYLAGRQEEIYRSVFARIASVLPDDGRFYMQSMVWGPNMIPVEQIDIDALRALPERDSDAWILALLGRQFPGSWLPFGQEQLIRSAEPHFRVLSSVSGRLDYIETISQWNRRIGKPSLRKTLLKLQLLPRWLTSSDFRLAFTSGVSANKVCFERELLEHYRLVFQKQR
jgi:cyclopropane-fatty-acyl-phospholipid synthase